MRTKEKIAERVRNENIVGVHLGRKQCEDLLKNYIPGEVFLAKNITHIYMYIEKEDFLKFVTQEEYEKELRERDKKEGILQCDIASIDFKI